MSQKTFRLKEFALAKPKVFFALALSMLGIAIFFGIGYLLFNAPSVGNTEHAIWTFDRTLMLKQLDIRTQSLNAMMIDVTALGSQFTLYYFSIFAVFLLCSIRDFKSAIQFAIAAYGSNMLQSGIKNYFQRPRPSEIEKLVDIGSFSFPSGHACASAAIYLTMALVASHYLPRKAQRTLLFISALLLVFLISYSRIYLGVHYPSDVIAGGALGLTWALLVMSVRESFFPHKMSKV